MNGTDEHIRPPQPDRWNLTAPEIAAMLGRTGVTPWRGSPFLRLHGETTVSPPGASMEDTPEIREATARIARPDIILGLLHVPPGEPDVSWFYGAAGDRRFAVHRRDGGMWHRIVWPVRDTTLADLMETSVSIREPAVTDGFALTLDRRGFEALAVVVDFLQEETLRAAMNRRLPCVLQFDVDDLLCCCQRNLRGIDLRWMVQRSKLISPVRLAPDPEGLRSGLDALVRQGMLVREGALHASTARFSTACSLLAGCSGFFALSTRRRMTRGNGEDAWDFQHMAAMRAIGSLWLLEFSDISAGDFTLKLGDVTASLLHERVAAGLLPPERTPVADDDAAEKQELCQNCGSPLQPPARFCPNCGARVVEKAARAAEAEAAPEPPPPGPATPAGPEASGIPCPKCGAVIASSKKFCTRCGTPLR